MFGFNEMTDNPELRINTKGLRKDKFYIGFMVTFWIVWVPITFFALKNAVNDFSFFWAIWLPFGFIGVVGIPLSLYGINGSHKIIVERNGIRIISDKVLIQRNVFIPKDDLESVMIGHDKSDGETESVATLNIYKKSGFWNNRIMIAPYTHPNEKKRIYLKIVSFLNENKFEFTSIDTLSKEKTEPQL